MTINTEAEEGLAEHQTGYTETDLSSYRHGGLPEKD
jgi:hypothetical protein